MANTRKAKKRSSSLSSSRKAKTSSSSPEKQQAEKPVVVVGKNSRKKRIVNKVSNFSLSENTKLQLCSVTSVCISFGHHTQDILRFFDRFSWKYIDFGANKKIEKVGKESANGFNYMIPFRRDKYTAYGLLKSCLEKTSDNLKYEACVGSFVNKLHQLFPVFMQTYRYGKYPNSTTFKKIKNQSSGENIKPELTKIVMEPITNFTFENLESILNDSCVKSEFNCILNEFIPMATTFEDYLYDNLLNTSFWNFEFIQMIFQLYSVLSNISTVFTHYDLHLQNVLLYSPVYPNSDNVCVELRYNLPNNEKIVIYTQYIVKIIDYGRCFFHENENMNTKKIYEMVCRARNCEPDCGTNSGYYVLNGAFNDESFIFPQVKNESHDLRLIKNISTKIKKLENTCPEYLLQCLDKIKYDNFYGTKEVESTKTGFSTNDAINNVHDAYHWFLHLVKQPEFQNRNAEMARTHAKIGVLDIWLDGSMKPMKWIEQNSESLTPYIRPPSIRIKNRMHKI